MRNQSVSVYDQLQTLDIALPELTAPVAAFVPFLKVGNLLFISGHIAKREGTPWVGQLGTTLTTAEGTEAARAVAVDLMGTLQGAVGDLNRIARIVRLMVLVNSAPSFTEQHLVANGASELFAQVFGEAGQHVRAAFGVAQVPFGSCIEIDLVAEVAA